MSGAEWINPSGGVNGWTEDDVGSDSWVDIDYVLGTQTEGQSMERRTGTGQDLGSDPRLEVENRKPREAGLFAKQSKSRSN